MLSPSRRLKLLAAIRHEAGHILAAILVRIRVRWSIARPDGSGATDLVRPLEAFANKRLTTLWDYVTAGPQNVAARWTALQQSFPGDRPPTSVSVRDRGAAAVGTENPFPDLAALWADDGVRVVVDQWNHGTGQL